MQHEAKATLNLGFGWKMILPIEKLVPQSNELSESKVAEFRSMLREGHQQPPLLVYPIGDMFQIRDGGHRFAACIAEGQNKIECIVVGGPGAAGEE
jgi:ParB-like chromosome segregation protein Spo0J